MPKVVPTGDAVSSVGELVIPDKRPASDLGDGDGHVHLAPGILDNDDHDAFSSGSKADIVAEVDVIPDADENPAPGIPRCARCGGLAGEPGAQNTPC